MSAVLQLILSQDYSLPAETEEDDYGNWLEVTGGSENPLRALRITEVELLGVQAGVEELCSVADSQNACLVKAQFTDFWERLNGLQAAVLRYCGGDGICVGANLVGGKLAQDRGRGTFHPVTPTPKGKLKEIIQSLQKASERAAHRPIPPSDLQYADEGSQFSLSPLSASQGLEQCPLCATRKKDTTKNVVKLRYPTCSADVSWNALFEGEELLLWMNGVCGVPVDTAVGVCLGLLSVGVLEKVPNSNKEFTLKAKYGWAGATKAPVGQMDLQEAWPPLQKSPDLMGGSRDPTNRLNYTEKEHSAVIQQVERQHSQAMELVQSRHEEVMSGLKQTHSREIGKLEEHISDLKQQLSQAKRERKGASDEQKQSNTFLKKENVSVKTPPLITITSPEATNANPTIAVPPIAGVVPPPPPITGIVPPPPPIAGVVPPPPPIAGVVPPPPPIAGVVPPPPPIAGVVPPPPPIAGVVPPPPPIAGVVPPPPPIAGVVPPPPPIAGILPPGRPSRVEQYKPNVAMKALFWRRIQYSAVDIGRRDVVWKRIHEPELRDIKQFENLFAKKGNPSGSKKGALAESFGGRSRAPRAVQLLDQKRSQAVGILMRSLHVEMSDIRNAVYHLDTSLLELESLAALRDIQGTTEELESITAQLKSHPEVTLDKPEMFLWSLSELQQFDERVSSLLFQTSFKEELSAVQGRVETIKAACHALQTSPGVCEVLGIVLALGNVMNSGNRQRGLADGFDLTILGKLKEVRSSNNTGKHLLQFIANYYVTHLDQHAGTVGAVFPLPDPIDILAASQIQFDAVLNDLEQLRKELTACRCQVDKVIKHSPTALLEPFQQTMNNFIIAAETSILTSNRELETGIAQFESLVGYYCVQPQDKEDSVSPSHFFTLWFPFVRDFRDCWQREQKAAAKRRQIAQQVDRLTNTALKPASKTGLKARLTKRARKQ